MKRKLIAWTLLLAIVANLAGCSSGSSLSKADPTHVGDQENATLDLLSTMIRQSVASKTSDALLSDSMADFSVAFLQNSHDGGCNTIISPYSVYLALAMTANGAKGETLSQMETLLGLSVQDVNPYALHLQNAGGAELVQANALWIHESLSTEEAFLQTLKNYYTAQVYKGAFDDSTLEAMNSWVRLQTKDRIPQALEQMDPNAMMYLLNALTFDGSWKKPYTTQDLSEQIFYSSSGEQTAKMMTSTESFYLNDGHATGFLKDYEGEQYAFFALLPNEGLSLEEYLSCLTGDVLLRTIDNAEATTVIATMPKLQLETALDMTDILPRMGMVDAFTMDADLSGINGSHDLYISRILHKTYLQVDEAGTQAGALTVEEVVTKGVAINQEYVFLNRPYIMGIYDKINHCFLFLGTVENP